MHSKLKEEPSLILSDYESGVVSKIDHNQLSVYQSNLMDAQTLKDAL